MPSPTSADTTPTSVTFGISCPLAIICVPTRMSKLRSRKLVQDVFELPLAGDRIAIEPGNLRRGKFRVQLIFHALGPRAHEMNVLALAFRANRRNLFGISAVMAKQTAVAAVPRQREGAVDAFDRARRRSGRPRSSKIRGG